MPKKRKKGSATIAGKFLGAEGGKRPRQGESVKNFRLDSRARSGVKHKRKTRLGL